VLAVSITSNFFNRPAAIRVTRHSPLAKKNRNKTNNSVQHFPKNKSKFERKLNPRRLCVYATFFIEFFYFSNFSVRFRFF
jgi:hypothetical protein